MKLLGTVLILAIIAVIAWNVHEHLAEGKPRCVWCKDILWTKDNQEQLSSTEWACHGCHSRAQKQAIKELGYLCISGTYRMDDRVPDRIYEILTGRSR